MMRKQPLRRARLGALLLSTACASSRPAPSASGASVEGAHGGVGQVSADDSQAADPRTSDPRYIWDLTDLYPSDDAWDGARNRVADRLPELKAMKGKLTRSATSLQQGLDLLFGLAKEAQRVRVYASLQSSVDLKSGTAAERKQQATQLLADLDQAASFMDPEILAAGDAKIRRFLAQSEDLSVYRFYLEDVLRRAPHTLGSEAESVVAASSVLANSPTEIYSTLMTADVEFPTIEIAGESVRMDQAGYVRFREHPDREVRKLAFDTFFGTLKKYRSSFGRILGSEVSANLYQTRVRNYDNVLEWALADDAVPEAVYTTLVEQVNASLPTLHRYLRLRARMLGIEQLGYHDMYPSLVESDATFDLETSRELTLAALAPLGEAYLEKLKFATGQRWQHVYPSTTKRGGAFMAGGAYDVHPYIMLNHNDSFDSLSTYAHEWGHAVHSMLANEAQPYPTAAYATFLAEVASIGNELFLSAYMLENADSDEERLFYLGQELETFRTTYFRQAMFAEFELAIHREVERGGALSGERISAIYEDLLKKYYGHDEGVVRIEDPVQMEWVFVPHFYYDFYVFQYATSIAGGALLVDKVLEEGDAARERLLQVFRAGGSDHPYEILRRAGIDLAEPEAHQALVERMDRVLDQVERLLAKTEAAPN